MEYFKQAKRYYKQLKKKFMISRSQIYESFGNFKYSKVALGGLDDILAKYIDFQNGFFIEVGANDGYSFSNTYYLERFLGWQGLLVEAIPENYRRCKRLREKDGKVFVYNCALVSNDYTEATVEMNFANHMSLVKGAKGSDEKDIEHIDRGLKIQNLKDTYSIQVPARTLESILDELPQPLNIDFFSLDVEGYELNILKGLNIHKYRPKYILVEANYFDEINNFLEGIYEMVEQVSSKDYLYRLK